MDLLTPSPSTSWCSYKGHATWWNAEVDGATFADVAWSYEEPLAESVGARRDAELRRARRERRRGVADRVGLVVSFPGRRGTRSA